MKKAILSAMLVMSTLLVVAQISRGTKMIGGTIKFSRHTEKSKDDGQKTEVDGKSTSLGINPSFGYFLADNFVVGAGVGLWSNNIESEGDNKYTVDSRGVSFTPFLRGYTKNFFLHVQASLGSTKTEVKSSWSNYDFKTSLSGINLGAGYAIFLNDFVAIEPMLGYEVTSLKNKESKNKDITSGLYFRVGIQAYLRR